MTITETQVTRRFRRYDHLERMGTRHTDGIDYGKVYVFPKLDGTNASIWLGEDGTLRAGSRNRELTLEADNAGFLAWAQQQDVLVKAVNDNPECIFYGEWLVPHTLKTYRDEAWRSFWLFDLYDRQDRTRYLPYEEYGNRCSAEGMNVIEPLCTFDNPSEDQLRAQVEMNTYLIQDGAGVGEGVVIKNYGWQAPDKVWAKIVHNTFKEESRRAFGTTHKGGEFQVEAAIVEEFVTPHLVGKTRAKIVLDLANDTGVDADAMKDPNWQRHVEGDNRKALIPRLLATVYHDLITEEMWHILKKHKNAKIDFKKLQGLTILTVKSTASDLF